MNICIHGFVGTDCPYCRTDTTIAKGKLANKINMSTQWKRLQDERPQPEQLIWFVDTLSPDVRPRCVSWGDGWTPTATQFWLPAEPPALPPDESEAAFEEWWKTKGEYPVDKDVARVAWHAALAWHKNKTKE